MCRKDVPVCASSSSSSSEAAKARTAAQLRMDPHLVLHACSINPFPQDWRLRPGLRFGQQGQEPSGFPRTNVPQTHQPGRPTEPCGVVPRALGTLFPSGDESLQHRTILIRRLGLRRTVAKQRGNQRGATANCAHPKRSPTTRR